MKLYKLIQLRLKTYFRNTPLILALGLFLFILWTILNFTSKGKQDVFAIAIGIVDLDQTKYSALITERVSKNDTISIETLSQEEALKQVSTGKLEAVFILKQGLMDEILKGKTNEIIEIVKSPVSLSAEIIGELFSAETMRLSSNVDTANEISQLYGSSLDEKNILWKEAWERTDGYWEPGPLITIDYRSTDQDMSGNDSIKDITKIKENTSQILILTLLMFSILIATSSLLNEKNNGTFKRIASSDTPLWIYLLSAVLSIVIVHTLGLIIMMSFSKSLWTETAEFVKELTIYIIYMVWAGSLGLSMIFFTKKKQDLLIVIPFIALTNGLLMWSIL